jgi:uncharacterized protein YqgC (DUF456 family)
MRAMGDMQWLLVTLCAIAMVAGLVGVVVPVLPGLFLSYGAVVVWAIFADAGWVKWLVLALCTVWLAVGTVVKYAWPGRNIKAAGVPNRTIVLGVLLGIVGFFVIPVVGLPIGFVAGVWLAEWARLGDPKAAWPSTWQALKATGLAMMIELGAGLLIAGTWAVGAFLAY